MNAFPTIEKMCEQGMSGYHGTNPLKVLHDPGVKFPRPPPDYFECDTCGFYSLTRKCFCIRDSGD
jgi:hypothetical protein